MSAAAQKLRAAAFVFLSAALVSVTGPLDRAMAQNADWAPSDPADLSSLNLPNNWSPVGVPRGTATFGETILEGLIPTTTAPTTFGEIMFTSLAPRYNFSISGGNTLTLDGVGIANPFTTPGQNFVVLPSSTLSFVDSSSASSSTGLISFSNRGGTILFSANSTAGNANFEDESDSSLLLTSR